MLALLLLAKMKSPVFKKVLGVGRVLAYGTAVSLVLGGLAARSAVAGMREDGLKLGHRLEGLGDLVGTTQEVRLNNQPIFFSSNNVAGDPAAVLDRFDAYCDSNKSMEGITWEDVLDGKVNPKHEQLNLTKVREQGSGEGFVLCFVKGENTANNWFEAAQSFREGGAGDMSKFGDLRYVHVSPATNKPGTSFVKLVWTSGSFSLAAMNPAGEGQDTPGSDSADIPRPDNAQRILTAVAATTPYTARIYTTNDPADVVAAEYDQKMEARDWLGIKPAKEDRMSRWYEHEGKQAMVSIETAKDGKTTVVVSEMGADEAPPTMKVFQ